MPSRPKRPCYQPGCGQLIDPSDRLCFKHRRQVNQSRKTTKARGYHGNWERIRARRLREEPLCRECLKAGRTTAANEVDHIIPRARGGTDADDNLQSLCKPCHSTKTIRENLNARARVRGRTVNSLAPIDSRNRVLGARVAARNSAIRALLYQRI